MTQSRRRRTSSSCRCCSLLNCARGAGTPTRRPTVSRTRPPIEYKALPMMRNMRGNQMTIRNSTHDMRSFRSAHALSLPRCSQFVSFHRCVLPGKADDGTSNVPVRRIWLRCSSDNGRNEPSSPIARSCTFSCGRCGYSKRSVNDVGGSSTSNRDHVKSRDSASSASARSIARRRCTVATYNGSCSMRCWTLSSSNSGSMPMASSLQCTAPRCACTCSSVMLHSAWRLARSALVSSMLSSSPTMRPTASRGPVVVVEASAACSSATSIATRSLSAATVVSAISAINAAEAASSSSSLSE